jgi:murein L,D-transpeptidase YafK
MMETWWRKTVAGARARLSVPVARAKGRRVNRFLRAAGVILLLALAAGVGVWSWMDRDVVEVGVSERSLEVRRRVLPRLQREARAQGLRIGAPVFLRSFKESREMEVWLETTEGGPFALFRTYPVANWGPGTLGPKLQEGDGQSPEGFYAVGPAQLNPHSAYHLSFNTGYPNAHDTALGRTGSFIMVHGGEGSIGCLAVTDENVEEIYVMVETALRKGQAAVPMHLLPFRLRPERLVRETDHPWHGFWQNLREGDARFEVTKRPPAVRVAGGRYEFD